MKREKESAEVQAAFTTRFEALSRFSYVSPIGLQIFPAPSQISLIEEGEKLHHCVGGYATRHANGQTAIFFVRKIETPDEPFFTLELNEKTLSVVQNRGLRNCARTPEVVAFEEEWLQYIKTIKKGKKNGKSNHTRTA